MYKTKYFIKEIRMLFRFLIITIILIGCKTQSQEFFILPKGFRGEVVVVYDPAIGENVNSLDGNIIYNIPPTGVLIANLPPRCNINKRRYFIINEFGQLVEIDKMTTLQEERNWDSETNLQDKEQYKVGVYMEGCSFKEDVGYNSQSAIIFTYKELQDSLRSSFFLSRNDSLILKKMKNTTHK